jgi:hypothetical protein
LICEIRVRFNPLLEYSCEFVVRDDDVLIDLWNLVNVIQHPAKDGIFAYLQQWFGEVFRQLS